MLNFTVGPVQSSEEVKRLGAENVPYFRTQEFSNLMFENEKLIKEFADADDNAKVVFITGSGTASMEASIINTLNLNDKVLIVNGGSFGHRFVEICEIHDIPHDEIKLNVGEQLTEEILSQYDDKNYTAFLINVHETSTGILYNMELVSNFCKRNNLFLITDCISAFLADKYSMKKYGADVMITGSQKALACPPGVSIIVLSDRAIKRVEKNNSKCLYFDLKNVLKNAERGQTPFTPAVGILIQINSRLKRIKENGGAEFEINRTKKLAEYFRNKLKEEKFPFEYVTASMSNAVTSLHPTTASANDIFLKLKDEYKIWVCPNGGELKEKIFRVGHIGELTFNDYDVLIEALRNMRDNKEI